MQRGGKFKKYENGRSFSNGKTRDGAYKASSKYLSNIKRSLPRARKSSGSTISHVKYKCLEVEFGLTKHRWWRRRVMRKSELNYEFNEKYIFTFINFRRKK